MRIGSIFVHLGESVLEWFAARAAGDADRYNSTRKRIANFVLPAVKKDLRLMGFSNIKIGWSKHAGCSMCPCSPGYAITADHPSRSVVNDIKYGKAQSYAIAYYVDEKGEIERRLHGEERYYREDLARELRVPLRKVIGKLKVG